jgi:DNA-binding CsgD family transcriptional regulator
VDTVDWSALALLLAERSGLPAIVIGDEGRLLFVTPAAQQVLGWRHDGVGGNWIQRYVVSGSATWAFEKTLTGALRRFDIEVFTSEGLALASFESYAVGRQGSRAVLLLLEGTVPAPSERASDHEYDYVVQGIAEGNFSLRSLRRLGSRPWQGSGTCHEVLHGRAEPCEYCPLRTRPPPRVFVESISPLEYELTTAVVGNSGETRISVRRVPTAVFAALLQARLDELSHAADLSKRERDVLRQLVDGQAIDQIAAALDISARTVKFHQANLLQKLGADSRVDLMRLLF